MSTCPSVPSSTTLWAPAAERGQSVGLWCLEDAGRLAVILPLNIPLIPSDHSVRAVTAWGYFGTDAEAPSFQEIRLEEIWGPEARVHVKSLDAGQDLRLMARLPHPPRSSLLPDSPSLC